MSPDLAFGLADFSIASEGCVVLLRGGRGDRIRLAVDGRPTTCRTATGSSVASQRARMARYQSRRFSVSSGINRQVTYSPKFPAYTS
jgi:hypothetical protein